MTTTQNPAYSLFRYPTRPRGYAHQNGTCGGHGDLCYECHKAEHDWHLRVAEAIAETDPPQEDETLSAYWHRVGGRFLDTWPSASLHAFKHAGKKTSGLN